jgi:hypothetical protein
MSPARDRSRIPRWAWFVVAAILAGIPIVVSIGVPTTPVPPHAAPAPDAAVVPPAAGDPDLGVTTPRTPDDVAHDALESEMATLKIEKEAIEAEASTLRGKREELESFERDHPDGVPPELYSRYEDARAAYNSDVQAFNSRAAAYRMKVDEIERRTEALHPTTP